MHGTPSPYYRSLNRPQWIAGIDRQLFFLILGLTIPIAYSARFAVVMDIAAFAVFLLLYLLALQITKQDYRMLRLFRRHIHYRKYYAALPQLHAVMKPIQPSVPNYLFKRGLS